MPLPAHLHCESPCSEVIIEHFELLDKSVYRWIPMPGGHLKLILGNQEYVLLQQVEIERYKVSLVNGENIKLLSSQLLTLSYAQGVAEDSARQLSRKVSMKTASWNNEPATANQKTYLIGLGVKELPEAITRGEAADSIDRIKAEKDAIPATAKQIHKLKSLGVDIPSMLNKNTAHKLIGTAMEKAK